MTALERFTAQIQRDIIFDPKFGGILARYSRRVESEGGDDVGTKTTTLHVSPQGNAAATGNGIEKRINVLWAKTEDLKFDGVSFLPKEGDVIEYKIGGVLHKYKVTRSPLTLSNVGSGAVFSYEDSQNSIIKMMTVRLQ